MLWIEEHLGQLVNPELVLFEYVLVKEARRYALKRIKPKWNRGTTNEKKIGRNKTGYSILFLFLC